MTTEIGRGELAGARADTPRSAGAEGCRRGAEARPRGSGLEDRSPRWRVLIVDDSPAILEAIEALISATDGGLVVGRAASGEAALEETDRARPDLILMDLDMPGMGGLEAARRISGHADAPPVVIMTAHEQPAYREAALRAGASGFLVKSRLDEELPSVLISTVPASGPREISTPMMEFPPLEPEGRDVPTRGGRPPGRPDLHGNPTGRPPGADDDPRAKGRPGPLDPAARPARLPGGVADGAGPLIESLRDFVAILAQIRDRDATTPEDDPSVWGDDEHVYLESEAPGPSDLDLDLCIRGGRLYVRIAR